MAEIEKKNAETRLINSQAKKNELEALKKMKEIAENAKFIEEKNLQELPNIEEVEQRLANNIKLLEKAYAGSIDFEEEDIDLKGGLNEIKGTLREVIEDTVREQQITKSPSLLNKSNNEID